MSPFFEFDAKAAQRFTRSYFEERAVVYSNDAELVDDALTGDCSDEGLVEFIHQALDGTGVVRRADDGSMPELRCYLLHGDDFAVLSILPAIQERMPRENRGFSSAMFEVKDVLPDAVEIDIAGNYDVSVDVLVATLATVTDFLNTAVDDAAAFIKPLSGASASV